MNTATKTADPYREKAYRYPGTRPFYDTDTDRRLFFGREAESERLLHRVLTADLVVLFGKSGLGKTSLVNAGLNEKLRTEGFMPLPVRFNDLSLEAVPTVFARIKDLAKLRGLDYEHGNENSLWEFFKTSAFWGPGDRLLKPVLILDQFEEFFTMHGPESRQRFIGQLADLVNGVVPDGAATEMGDENGVDGAFPYSEKAPEVKVLISIREDFLGDLEELAAGIPGVLHNRFRLLPLSREQAKRAIEEPARLQAEGVEAERFSFAPDTVKGMLDFLCRRRERGELRKTDEVEAFQLQLLCGYGEERAHERRREKNGDICLEPGDMGGEKGMQKVLESFYDTGVSGVRGILRRRRVRRLCERGLISGSGRRLSLEAEDIEDRFSVSAPLLRKLVDCRLLRAEPRLDGVYYELSHDTLVAPIRQSRKRRVSNHRLKVEIPILVLCCIILLVVFLRDDIDTRINKIYTGAKELESNFDFKGASEKYEAILKLDKTYVKAYLGIAYPLNNEKSIEIYKMALTNGVRDARIYNRLGEAFFEIKKYNQAVAAYEKAIEINPNYRIDYFNLGCAYQELKKHAEAIATYKKALQIKPDYATTYNNMGAAYAHLTKYAEAIAAYKKAIQIKPDYAGAYYNMGNAFYQTKKYAEAIAAYKKAIQIKPDYATAYYNMGNAFYRTKKYAEAISAYQKAIQIKPDYMSAKASLAGLYLISGNFQDAGTAALEILKKKNVSIRHTLAMHLVSIASSLFQDNPQDARRQLTDFFKYYRSLSKGYERGWSYKLFKEFVTDNPLLTPAETRLLLQLTDMLESPLPEGKKKLPAVEKTAKEVLGQ